MKLEVSIYGHISPLSQKEIPKTFLNKVMGKLIKEKESGRRETVSAFIDSIPFPDEVEHHTMMNEKLKSIISIIQKEQNRMIRNEKSGTLIIQWIAGSGKTSTALHRIAFLLYCYKDK